MLVNRSCLTCLGRRLNWKSPTGSADARNLGEGRSERSRSCQSTCRVLSSPLGGTTRAQLQITHTHTTKDRGASRHHGFSMQAEKRRLHLYFKSPGRREHLLWAHSVGSNRCGSKGEKSTLQNADYGFIYTYKSWEKDWKAGWSWMRSFRSASLEDLNS